MCERFQATLTAAVAVLAIVRIDRRICNENV